MRLPRVLWSIGVSVFLLALLASCSSGSSYSAREKVSTKADGDISIALVTTQAKNSLFLQGAKLAIDEINSQGGVMGRKIRALCYDDKGSVSTGHDIAESVADNTHVVAVVGHLYSDVAIPAAITYNRNGMVFLSPTATNPTLTQLGFKFVFRNAPTDNEIALGAANFVAHSSYKSVLVFYQATSYGKRLGNLFAQYASEKGIGIPMMRSFFDWQRDFRPMISDIMDSCQFDCIFIAGLLPTAGHLIQQIRQMGIKTPIVAGDGLNMPLLLTVAGKAADGTTVAALFNPHQARPEVQAFMKHFVAKYGRAPDSDAAQGYDAVRVLAHAMEKSRSTVPIVVSATLRYLKHYRGVTGTYSFTRNGDVIGKPVFFKTVRNGKFVYSDFVFNR